MGLTDIKRILKGGTQCKACGGTGRNKILPHMRCDFCQGTGIRFLKPQTKSKGAK